MYSSSAGRQRNITQRRFFRPDSRTDILPYASIALKQRRQQQNSLRPPAASFGHPNLRTSSHPPCPTTIPLPSVRNLKYKPLRKEPLMLKQRLGPAGGRFWFACFFSLHVVIQRRGDGGILGCRLHPAFCSSTRGARWRWWWGGCGPSFASQQAVCVMFSLIHHLHTRRRIYLIYLNMQQAKDVCGHMR